MRIDLSGPQMSKYCDDGGVYYTYNFIERGAGLGNVGLPWGAENLSKADNDLKVSLPIQMISTTCNLS